MKTYHIIAAPVVAWTMALAGPAAAQTYPNIVPVSEEAQAMIETEAFYLPEGQWSLIPDTDGCSLQRHFTRGGERITLAMKQLEAGMPVQYALIGAGLNEREPFDMGFVPGTGLAHITRIGEASLGERDGVYFGGQVFPRGEGETVDDAGLAPQTQVFVIQSEDHAPMVLRTGPVHLAMNALAECGRRNLESFGVDTRERQLSQQVQFNNFDEVSAHMSVAYPASARRAGLQGPINIRVIVDDTGKVTHCHAGDQLTARALRETACDVMREKGDFAPARDATGGPVTAAFRTRIIFYMQQPF